MGCVTFGAGLALKESNDLSPRLSLLFSLDRIEVENLGPSGLVSAFFSTYCAAYGLAPLSHITLGCFLESR